MANQTYTPYSNQPTNQPVVPPLVTSNQVLPPWWNQALPQGWEAKYDPGQRRYFFISHVTKTTSWEDPRKVMWEQRYGLTAPGHSSRGHSPQPSPRRSPVPSPGHSPGGAHRPQNIQQQTIPQQDIHKPTWQKEVEDKYNLAVFGDDEDEDEDEPPDHRPPSVQETAFVRVDEQKLQKLMQIFTTADEQIVRSVLSKNKNHEAHAIAELQQMGFHRADHTPTPTSNFEVHVNNIIRDFPTVDHGVIRNVLQGVHNSEAKARHELRMMGYKMVSSSQHSSHAGTPTQSSGRSTSRSREHSPHRKASHQRSASPGRRSPRRSLSPAATPQVEPQAPTAQEKSRMKDKLQAEFPDQAHSVVEMALDACQYDEARARSLLQTMDVSHQRSRAGSKGKESRSSRSSRSSSLGPAEPKPVSTAPQVFGPTAGSQPQYTSTPSITVSAPAKKPEPSSLNKLLSRPSPLATPTTTTIQQTTADRGRTEWRSRPTQAVTREPVRSYTAQHGTYNSPNRTAPKGPDKSLVLGPCKEILITDYLDWNGPNSEYRRGPDASNYSGPTWYTGPDHTLANGPNQALHCGPNHGLVQGSVYTYGRRKYTTAF